MVISNKQLDYFNNIHLENRRLRIRDFIASQIASGTDDEVNPEEESAKILKLGQKYWLEYDSSYFLLSSIVLKYPDFPADVLSDDQLSLLEDEIIPEISKIQLLQFILNKQEENNPQDIQESNV